MDKRGFIKSLAGFALATPFFSKLEDWVAEIGHLTADEVAKDEMFWYKIRSGYKLKPDYINLESGYYNIIPQETLENFIHQVRRINYEGSYYMRNGQWKNKDYVASRLAQVIGAEDDEVIVTRNTTESLDTIIGGYHWEKGDQAVWATHDYGAMQDQFRLMERRYGIENIVVDVPIHPKSDDEIVQVYENALTEKTKLLMICHIINITGHILPVRKICDMAHSKGVDVMVDGAHAVAHFEFNINDLNCDYYGSSLHKWLAAPLGSGLLYVKKDKARNVWPLFGERNRQPEDIKKLNHTGTHPVHTDLSIINAIEYYNIIGGARKEARLRYLQNYWTDQVRDLPGIILNTPKERHRSCGIANVGVEGMTPVELMKTLHKKYRVYTVAISTHGVDGVRVSPNVFNTTAEMDVLVRALKELA